MDELTRLFRRGWARRGRWTGCALGRLLGRRLALLVRRVLVGVSAARVTPHTRSAGMERAVVLGLLLRGALAGFVLRGLVGLERRRRGCGRENRRGGTGQAGPRERRRAQHAAEDHGRGDD